MKPVPAIIAPGNIFLIREVDQPLFSSEFHFHEECQLAYIIKGSGKRIIGDSIDHFDENELVFIGSNIPHLWYDTENRGAENKNRHSISLSLFISPKQFLEHLTVFGNIHKIEQLFEKAQRGMFIFGKSKVRIISLLKKATQQHGIRHIITLLQIVDILSNTEEYKLLSSSSYTNFFQSRDNERMNNIYDYLIKNFKRDISLTRVAEIAAMNPHAFCRFFKSRTQKTLTQFINEIRIGHACKLLNNKDQSITQIAYKCGYNNVSNFNRFFKIVKKQSPREYRKELEF
jgi:AraC-like DNA-binding protein